MFCSNCGHIIPDDSEFCPDCGQFVKHAVVFSRESKTVKNVDTAVDVATAAAQKGMERGKEVSAEYAEKGKQFIQDQGAKGKGFVSAQVEKAKQAAAPSPARFCQNCGAPVPAGAKFCPSCGHSFLSDTRASGKSELKEQSEGKEKTEEIEKTGETGKAGGKEAAENVKAESNISKTARETGNLNTPQRIQEEQPEMRVISKEGTDESIAENVGGRRAEKRNTKQQDTLTEEDIPDKGEITQEHIPNKKTVTQTSNNNQDRNDLNTDEKEDKGAHVGAIIFIVILVILGLFLILVLIAAFSEIRDESSAGNTSDTASYESSAGSASGEEGTSSSAVAAITDKIASQDEIDLNNETVSADTDSAFEDTETSNSAQDRSYKCGDNFQTIVSDDVILELCRDERFAEEIQYDNIGVMQQDTEEINGVSCDIYQVVDVSTGTVKNMDWFALDSEDDVIYVYGINGWEADYGEAPTEGNEANDHTYSIDEIHEMVNIYVSTFENLPEYYIADFIDEDTVEIDMYETQDAEDPVDVAQVNADTGNGYIDQGGTDPIHFADYSPDNFLIPYVGIAEYSEEELLAMAENSAGSADGIYDFLNKAINEIYARHGRIFKDDEMRKFFESKAWYTGYVEGEDMDDNIENIFNDAEYANYQILVKLRNEYSAQ